MAFIAQNRAEKIAFDDAINLYFFCMSIKFISPKKAVNSAFLKLPVSVENMEQFKLSLTNLYKKRDLTKDEEYHKGEIWGFLKGIFNPDYSVQVKRPIDLAIFNGNDTSAKPAVIIEGRSENLKFKSTPSSANIAELLMWKG